MELTYDEIMVLLDIKKIPSERTGYTLPPGIYEISDINRTVEYLLPDIVRVNTTIHDVRLGSTLKNRQILIFTAKSSLYRS